VFAEGCGPARFGRSGGRRSGRVDPGIVYSPSSGHRGADATARDGWRETSPPRVRLSSLNPENRRSFTVAPRISSFPAPPIEACNARDVEGRRRTAPAASGGAMQRASMPNRKSDPAKAAHEDGSKHGR
jgi:hypothetical protein